NYKMGKFEKTFVVFTLLYTVIYAFFFFNLELASEGFDKILPFHFLGMALSLAFIIIVIRDIYKRDFENPNSKNTWIILVLLFWPSVFIYLVPDRKVIFYLLQVVMRQCFDEKLQISHILICLFASLMKENVLLSI
ncbi:MAG: hypothetical protein K0B14_19105, partial [Anaerolineaceae bacterium]|nr:hypothetical protein [Anaerolineaceae bacterium]